MPLGKENVMAARSNVKWTRDEIIYVLTSNKSIKELADELDRTPNAISLLKANLKRGHSAIKCHYKDGRCE